MKPIAIFHHCRVSGGDPPISFDWAIGIVAEQIIALRDSDLTWAASEYYIGVNGGEDDAAAIQSLAPAKAMVVQHPEGSKGEQPTLNLLYQWAMGTPKGYACYIHTKGATHTGDPISAAWRECGMRGVVHNWEQCVKDLDRGMDMVGCHWVTQEKYPFIPIGPYFAGNFWWATADFILSLPPIAETAVENLNRYDAECWVARGKRKAKVVDYARHWPGAKCHQSIHEQKL